jgi:radical SAM protein with 4Fe4S-binding SPASM domain
MPQRDIIIEANSNFHHIAGENLFNKDDSRFREYRMKWKEWPEKFHAGGFPLFIDIEATSACNLKCTFCATTFRGKAVKKGFISSDAVKRIIDEGINNNLYGIKFNIRGEPLLHPEIHEFVKYAKQKGLIDVYFNTNAMLLTEKIAGKLIDAGLDRLSISFEGITKKIYEKYRVGAEYETVLSNIEKIQSLKEKLRVEHPKIRIQTVMLPEIVSAFEQYKSFWSKIADEVGFLDYKEMKEKKKGIEYPWACPQIWQRMAVWWDGTIFPCNHDDDGLLALGNIREISIKDSWQSAGLNKIRDIHRNGMAHTVSACDGCYLRDSEIAKLTEGNTGT